MDWGSLAGLLLAIGGIVAGQMLDGGHARSLVQPRLTFWRVGQSRQATPIAPLPGWIVLVP